MKIITILLIIWLIVGNITLILKTSKSYKLEYTGILWVILDHWSIWYHKSNDIPIQLIKITVTNLK